MAQDDQALLPGHGSMPPVSAEVNRETGLEYDSLRPADRAGGSDHRGGDPDASCDGSKLAELPAERGEASVEPVNVPHMAPAPNVLPFATRGTAKPLKSTSATRGTADGKWKVDYVRASENTYAFRLRWTVGRTRGTPIYISRVSAAVFQMIRKGDYEQFKKGLISDYCAGALRASNQA